MSRQYETNDGFILLYMCFKVAKAHQSQTTCDQKLCHANWNAKKCLLSLLLYGDREWKTYMKLIPNCGADFYLLNKALFWHCVGTDFIGNHQALLRQNVFKKHNLPVRKQKSHDSLRCDTDANLLPKRFLTSPANFSCARLRLHIWWTVIGCGYRLHV